MAKLLERALNTVVSAVFLAIGAVVRGVTAAAAFALRRGRHRQWRRQGEEAARRAAGSPDG